MIPKLIHHTAKTNKVDSKWEPFQKAVIKFHPGWTYKLWTDEDNLALLQERRPELESVYLGMPLPAMRADLMRYVYMEQFGGLYLDLDYQFLKPFDLLEKALVLPKESNEGQPDFLGNCVFASEKGHPFWTRLIEAIRVKPPTRQTVISEQDTIDQSGPGIVTKVWQEQFLRDPTVFVPPRAWFHPVRPETNQELETILSKAETYGIHWCFGTWRHRTLWARLKSQVRTVLQRRRSDSRTR